MNWELDVKIGAPLFRSMEVFPCGQDVRSHRERKLSDSPKTYRLRLRRLQRPQRRHRLRSQSELSFVVVIPVLFAPLISIEVTISSVIPSGRRGSLKETGNYDFLAHEFFEVLSPDDKLVLHAMVGGQVVIAIIIAHQPNGFNKGRPFGCCGALVLR